MIKPFQNYMAAYQADSKALLHDGNWTIEKLSELEEAQGFRSHRSDYFSLLKHVCYPKGYDGKVPYPENGSNCVYQVVVYPDVRSDCWRCAAKIPEGMVAVWKFQNWEQLKYGG
jgi:hypothetical protein